MCVALAALPAIAAGVSAAAGVAGAGISYEAGQSAAAEQRNAEQQNEEQQNTAFMQRNQAAQTQLAAETAANEKEDQAFSTNQANTQAAQMAALGQTQSTTNQLNQSEQAIATAANDTVARGVNQASASNLAAAQGAQTTAQENLNAPVVQAITTNNPLGAAASGPTAKAMAASDAASAKYVQNYGNNQAILQGFSAPITVANQAATGTQIGLMPVAAADQLLKGAAPSILAPSQLAYTQAGQLGSAIATADTSDQQQRLQLADSTAQDQTDLANLQQEDSGVVTQNQLTQQQQRAAQLAGLGQGLTTVGNVGLNAAGSQGAFTGLGKAIAGMFGSSTGATANTLANATGSDPAEFTGSSGVY